MEIKEGTRLGDYILVSKIGEGGWGTVWKAFCVNDGTCVAAKVLKFNSSDRLRCERFRKESEVMTRISSPYVCRSFSRYESADGTVLCYFMEFLEGRTVSEVFDVSPCVPVGKIKRWIVQLALALQDIHAMSLVHRDIKPSNVMVLANGNVKVFDFGIVKDLAKDSSKTQGNPFTLKYASPEQKDSAATIVDHRSDFYSLGKLVYFMATGGSEVPDDQPVNLEEAIPNYDLRRIVALLTEPDLNLRARNIDIFMREIVPDILNTEQPTEVDTEQESETVFIESPTLADDEVENPTPVIPAGKKGVRRKHINSAIGALSCVLLAILSFYFTRLTVTGNNSQRLDQTANVTEHETTTDVESISGIEGIPAVSLIGKTPSFDEEKTVPPATREEISQINVPGDYVASTEDTGSKVELVEVTVAVAPPSICRPSWWGKRDLDTWERSELNRLVLDIENLHGPDYISVMDSISTFYSLWLRGPQMEIVHNYDLQRSIANR